MISYAVYILLMLCKPEITSLSGTAMTDDYGEHEIQILTEAFIEVLDPELVKVIDPNAEIRIIAEGHEWVEGPLWVESLNILLYNDVPRNTTYSWKEGTGVAVYLNPSGFTGENFTGPEPGANGLNINRNGELVLCQHGDRRIAKMNSPLDKPESTFITLTDNFEGKRLNSPNDAVFNKKGDLYFTDPPYGLPKHMDDPGKEIPFQGVYRMDRKGETILLTDEFTRPNGIAFSPDEKILYVANSDPDAALWKSFEVTKKGTLTNGKVFYDATNQVATSKGLPDGLKVNKAGIVFATGPGGVYVFSSGARLLGMIRTGQATSNCALNADHSVLYITADMYVLQVRLK